jgi:hypothetical protein
MAFIRNIAGVAVHASAENTYRGVEEVLTVFGGLKSQDRAAQKVLD